MTSEAERRALLRIARDAILERVGGRAAPARSHEGAALRCAAAFVTLHHRGALRGCIGHLQTDLPLGRVIAQCAVSAATGDPRFPAVTADEALALDIELSILGPLEPVVTLEDIAVGRHGLMIECGWRRGLLLPQVAVEWRWDAKTFVDHTHQKAGLAHDTWASGRGTLWRFEAEVFSGPASEAF